MDTITESGTAISSGNQIASSGTATSDYPKPKADRKKGSNKNNKGNLKDSRAQKHSNKDRFIFNIVSGDPFFPEFPVFLFVFWTSRKLFDNIVLLFRCPNPYIVHPGAKNKNDYFPALISLLPPAPLPGRSPCIRQKSGAGQHWGIIQQQQLIV